MSTSRKVVLGLGNILYSDEGVGVEALRSLTARLGEQDRVEIIDGGTLGLNLLPIVEDCSYLLVLDTINAGKAPGTLIELPGEEIPLYAGIKLSEHQVTFQEVLGLATLRGHVPPHLYLVGVQPQELAMGIGLTPVVAAAVPLMIERAVAVLHDWGLA
jgi:hydrogenase maturation protease